MGRLFLVITGPILLILLVDSALHDPDVHPFVAGTIDRASSLADVLAGWSGNDSTTAVESAYSGSARAAPADAGRTHSTVPGWYWSTILAVAATCLGLIKIARAVTFRNRPADPSRESVADSVRPEAGP